MATTVQHPAQDTDLDALLTKVRDVFAEDDRRDALARYTEIVFWRGRVNERPELASQAAQA
jgi:hypothetical protein